MHSEQQRGAETKEINFSSAYELKLNGTNHAGHTRRGVPTIMGKVKFKNKSQQLPQRMDRADHLHQSY